MAELPAVSWLAPDQTAAFDGIQRLAAETVEDLCGNGEPVPEALADRTFSGKFVVRVPPETHRELALEAAEQGVSLNRLAAAKLAHH